MSGISSASPLAEGLRRALPIVLGYLPVGFAFGVLAVKNNIPPSLAVAMSVLMFSGSGQFVFAGMWGAGAGAFSIIAAVFIVNLRYLLQSAAESPWLVGLPRLHRFLLGLGLTDETFAVYTTTANAPRTPRYFFSMALCSYLSWALGSWLGAIATGLLPPLITAALGISLYAMFIGLLMPGLHGNGRLAALVVLTALCNTVLCNVVQLDSGWSMILSTLGCAALGSFFVTPNAAGEENSHAEP